MPIININNNGIGLGQICTAVENENKLEINDNWIISGLYPIGSIYLTTSEINPSNYFGGTWQTFGSGRVLVCVNTSDTDFDTPQKTGGASTHTLTLAQMPQHRHIHATENSKIKSSGAVDRPAAYSEGVTTNWWSNYGYSGSATAHNNLQPYITCYMWLRTA